MRRRYFLKTVPLLAAPSLARAETKPLRFVPQANLSSLDPVWTTATVAINHAFLVYDTLTALPRPARTSRRCARAMTSLRRTDLDVHATRQPGIP